jgi:hypothetical protein
VKAGAVNSLSCAGTGDICAGENLVADGSLLADKQVRAGTIDNPNCGSGAGNICAGANLIADNIVLAINQVGAGTVGSIRCDSTGDICAGEDLVSDGYVHVGSGCVTDSNLNQIAGACPSDLRLKMDIRAINPVLAQLAALQPVTFDWRRDEFPDLHLATEPGMGLIAQDVEAVLPGLVSEGADGYKRVHYERLPILMLQGIRELNEENTALRAEMQAKDNRIAALEDRLAAIERHLGTAPLVQASR